MNCYRERSIPCQSTTAIWSLTFPIRVLQHVSTHWGRATGWQVARGNQLAKCNSAAFQTYFSYGEFRSHIFTFRASESSVQSRVLDMFALLARVWYADFSWLIQNFFERGNYYINYVRFIRIFWSKIENILEMQSEHILLEKFSKTLCTRAQIELKLVLNCCSIYIFCTL